MPRRKTVTTRETKPKSNVLPLNREEYEALKKSLERSLSGVRFAIKLNRSGDVKGSVTITPGRGRTSFALEEAEKIRKALKRRGLATPEGLETSSDTARYMDGFGAVYKAVTPTVGGAAKTRQTSAPSKRSKTPSYKKTPQKMAVSTEKMTKQEYEAVKKSLARAKTRSLKDVRFSMKFNTTPPELAGSLNISPGRGKSSFDPDDVEILRKTLRRLGLTTRQGMARKSDNNKYLGGFIGVFRETLLAGAAPATSPQTRTRRQPTPAPVPSPPAPTPPPTPVADTEPDPDTYPGATEITPDIRDRTNSRLKAFKFLQEALGARNVAKGIQKAPFEGRTRPAFLVKMSYGKAEEIAKKTGWSVTVKKQAKRGNPTWFVILDRKGVKVKTPKEGQAKNAQDNAEKKVVSPERFLDLSSFYIALQVFELAGGTSEELFAHKDLGNKTAKHYIKPMRTMLQIHVSPLLVSGKVKKMKAPFEKVLTKKEAPGAFLYKLFALMARKQSVLDDLFTKKSKVAAKVGKACKKTASPLAVLKALAAVPSVSGLAGPRKWIIKAAELLGAGLSDFERDVSDAESAAHAVQDLKEIEKKSADVREDSKKAQELEEQKARKIKQIERLTESARDPDVAKNAAIAEATRKDDNARAGVAERLGLSPEQKSALTAEGKVIIGAGAGSGKTRVLAGKVAYFIEDRGYRPEQLLATSFTRKASRELGKRCQDYTQVPLGDSLVGSTTHSLALKMIGQYGTPGQKAGMLKVADDTVRELLVKIAVAQARLGEVDIIPQMLSYLREARERILDGEARQLFWMVRDRDTRRTVDYEGNPAGLLGGAIWRYLEQGRFPTENMMKHVSKVFDHFGSMGYPEDIFGKFESGMVRTAARKEEYADMQEEKRRTQLKALRDGLRKSRYLSEPAKQWFNLGVGDNLLTDVSKAGLAISKWKGSHKNPKALYDELLASKGPDSVKTQEAAVWGAYEWLKGNEPSLMESTHGSFAQDYDDALWLMGDILQQNGQARGVIQSKVKVLLIDEAQDLNPAQHRLFEYMAGMRNPETDERWEEEDPRRPPGGMTADTYCLIGDDKQAIYAFRGATPDEFINRSDTQGGDYQTELLTMNYRSGKAIVDAANQLIAHNDKQIPMTCKANVDRKGEGTIFSKQLQTYDDLASYAADTIQNALVNPDAGYNIEDFAVAVRTNAEMDAFERAFVARRLVYRRKGSFFQKKFVKAIMAWVEIAKATTKKDINRLFLDTALAPTSLFGEGTRKDLKERAGRDSYLDWLRGNKLYSQQYRQNTVNHHLKNVLFIRQVVGDGATAEELFNYILDLEGPKGESIRKAAQKKAKREDQEERAMSESDDAAEASARASKEESGGEEEGATETSEISTLRAMVEESGTVEEAVDYYKQLLKNAEKAKAGDEDKPAIDIITCHGWKGLERKHMFVPMNDTTFPPPQRIMTDNAGVPVSDHPLNETDEEYERRLEDERRLAYVALTRGENSVTVLTSGEDHKGRSCGPSQFISEACIKPEDVYYGGGEDEM